MCSLLYLSGEFGFESIWFYSWFISARLVGKFLKKFHWFIYMYISHQCPSSPPCKWWLHWFQSFLLRWASPNNCPPWMYHNRINVWGKGHSVTSPRVKAKGLWLSIVKMNSLDGMLWGDGFSGEKLGLYGDSLLISTTFPEARVWGERAWEGHWAH